MRIDRTVESIKNAFMDTLWIHKDNYEVSLKLILFWSLGESNAFSVFFTNFVRKNNAYKQSLRVCFVYKWYNLFKIWETKAIIIIIIGDR